MKRLVQPILAVALGLALGLGVTWVTGENPWNVLRIIARSAFGSGYDFGLTLFYTTPLIFTGLSVAMAFRAGLFNIGAQGQLTAGAVTAGIVGLVLSTWPGWLLIPVMIIASALAGAI